MSAKLNFDSTNTIINTIAGVVGSIVSILGIVITYGTVGQEVQQSIVAKARITLFCSAVLFLIFMVAILIRRFYFKRRIRIATDFVAYPNQAVMTLESIAALDLTRLDPVQKNCLHRIEGEPISSQFWQSSWLGAGSEGTLVDKINSVPIYEGTSIGGKVPVINEAFDEKWVSVLEIKYEHYVGGYWCAVVHGRYGKPIRGKWSTRFDLNKVSYIHFWAKSRDNLVVHPMDMDNPWGAPVFYVRFEDSDNVSSNSVMITVPGYWTEYNIPVSKFLYDLKLYRDYQEATKRQYFERRGVFKPEDVMQFMIGCGESMEEQAGTLHLYDIRFTT